MKIIGWTLLIIIILFAFWLGMIFGPVFHVSYDNCVDKTENNITHGIRIYKKIPIRGSKVLRQSTRSEKYNHPFLCIESFRHDDLCRINMDLAKYELQIIEAQTVRLTGRVIKQYAFNEFNNNMYTLEVLVNNKKYLINPWAYDDMTLKNPVQEYENHFKEPTCSIFEKLL